MEMQTPICWLVKWLQQIVDLVSRKTNANILANKVITISKIANINALISKAAMARKRVDINILVNKIVLPL